MKSRRRFTDTLDRFVAGRGFAILTILCVAVLTATALWTQQNPAENPAPTSYSVNREASALWQQTLPASTPTPLPTTLPLLWQAPLPETEVLSSFADDVLIRSDSTGLWSTHPAVDLAADPGTPVMAMASGRVLEYAEHSIDGAWISISHAGGYVSRYSGLSLLGALRPGDPVSAGQTIGFSGNTHVTESNLPAHLHLEVFLNDQPVDALTLFP